MSGKLFKCLRINSRQVEHLPLDEINENYVVNIENTTRQERKQLKTKMLSRAGGTEHLCEFSEGDLLYFRDYCDKSPKTYRIKLVDNQLVMHSGWTQKPVFVDPNF